MKVGIFGASGFVGSTLARAARAGGMETVCFSRRERVGFQTFQGPRDLEGIDAVVNLAGEPIFGIWTAGRRRRIVESRVDGTRRIVAALRGSSVRTLVNASAIGFYGDTGESEVSELSPAGKGFLAETCAAWESAALAAEPLGIRVVRLRIGFVIGTGGALALIRPLFSLGAGGNLGSGQQWMSCVHVEDVAGMILWALGAPEILGPLNAVMPKPVRNAEFTRTLAATLRRPAILQTPAFALRLALGDLSHVMLDSARVHPSVAIQHGYAYRFPDLAAALRGTTS